ncbi:MAG TPA: hypothetical protein VJN18_03275 [Polyangiaceae bacterium]|nr:hypothetical protein [Polyangiaceae bacterium]
MMSSSASFISPACVLVLSSMLALAAPRKAFAEPPAPSPPNTAKTPTAAPVAPPAAAAPEKTAKKPEGTDLVLLPLVARSEETNWQFGAAGIFFLPRPAELVPRTNFNASALISVRKQFTASIGTNAYLLQDRLRLSAVFDAFLWPTEFFLQDPPSDTPEKYSFAGTKGEALTAWRLVGKLFAGPSFKFSVQKNDVPSGGVMEGAGLTSLRGHTSAGPGLSIALDSRDIAYAATRGVYVGATAHYLFGLNSRTNGFFDYELFARGYLSSDSTHNVLALATELHGVSGDPPFSLMPTSDGTTVLRGIKRARYYDFRLVTAQAEYRRYLGYLGPTGPWGVTLFAEAGHFLRSLRTFGKRDIVVSVGAGLRYLIIPKDRVAIRLDVAYVDGGLGVVLNALEAF